MTQTKQQQLFKALNGIESQLEHVRSLINEVVPTGDWIDAKEFALRSNLKHKTVTNYAGKGTIKMVRKNISGHYLIHTSELDNWGK